MVYALVHHHLRAISRWVKDSPQAVLSALLVLVPLFSYVIRVRRVRRAGGASRSIGKTIPLDGPGMLQRLLQAVLDTVTMAGRGLV
jgi:hypothetical protein